MQFLISAGMFAVIIIVGVASAFIYDTIVSWWERGENDQHH